MKKQKGVLFMKHRVYREHSGAECEVKGFDWRVRRREAVMTTTTSRVWLEELIRRRGDGG